ncbi:hypothetical protein ACLOJK_040834 [Asimina triloba]
MCLTYGGSSSSVSPEPESSNMGWRIQEVKTTLKLERRKHVLKWLIVGGVLVAFGLNSGTLGKGIAFGIVKCCRRAQKHKKNEREGWMMNEIRGLSSVFISGLD